MCKRYMFLLLVAGAMVFSARAEFVQLKCSDIAKGDYLNDCVSACTALKRAETVDDARSVFKLRSTEDAGELCDEHSDSTALIKCKQAVATVKSEVQSLQDEEDLQEFKNSLTCS